MEKKTKMHFFPLICFPFPLYAASLPMSPKPVFPPGFCSNPSSHQQQLDWQSAREAGLSKRSKKTTFRAVPKTGCFPGNMENSVRLTTRGVHRFPRRCISSGTRRELPGRYNSSRCREHPSSSSPARVEGPRYALNSIWGDTAPCGGLCPTEGQSKHHYTCHALRPSTQQCHKMKTTQQQSTT